MADSDYSYDGDEVSGDEYVGSRASSSKAQSAAGGRQTAKAAAPKPQRKAWETEYSRTVEKTIVTVNDDDIGQSVQEREEERKRKRLRKDTKPFQRGIIRHVVLVLDLSEAMLEKDMRPNRYYTMINYTQDYVREFFEQNPISQMSVLGMHDGICIRVSELSGNPAEHVTAIAGLRSKETGKEPKGAPSLQNALELARATLYHTPNHGTREVIVVFGSLLSLDPGDIHQTVKACARDRIRVSIIGMGARLKICQEIVTRTNAGDESEYTIATDQEMLKELLIATTTPPVIRSDTASTPQQPEKGAALMMMGFPSRVVEDVPTICACHGNLTLGGYTCSRCSAKVCSLPVTCPSCQLTLLLSTHLARSYHHLFPLRNWKTVSWQRAREKNSRDCVGCLTTFPGIPSKQELAARALKKERQSTTGSMLNGHMPDGTNVDDDENGEQKASESARCDGLCLPAHTGNQTCHQHNIQTMNHKHPPRDLRMLVSLTNNEQALELEQASSNTSTQAPTPLPQYQFMNPEAPEFFGVYEYNHLSYTPSQESHPNPEAYTFAMGDGSKQHSGGKSGGTSGGMSKSDSSKIQSSQAKSGNSTGQGSLATRAQSAGARNGSAGGKASGGAKK